MPRPSRYPKGTPEVCTQRVARRGGKGRGRVAFMCLCDRCTIVRTVALNRVGRDFPAAGAEAIEGLVSNV